MVKHIWIIVDIERDEVFGTDDTDVVEQFVENSDCICIHAQSGIYFQGSRTAQEIETYRDEDEDESEEN